MPRIRTIKPEFPQSESIGRLTREARLLFIQIWTLCDDEGRTRAASRALASLLYPFDEDATKLIEGWLYELEQENCVERYRINGDTYLQVVNWLKHQKIDRPSKSKIPPFDESSRVLASPREPSCEDLRTKDQGRDQGSSVLRTDAGASQSGIIPNWKDHENEQKPRHRSSVEKPGDDPERNPKSLTPAELRSEFWRGAVAYLVQYVKGEQATRSVIGKWCKAHGTGAVIDAIAQAQTRGTPDPVAYIVATLKKTSSNGNGHAPPKKTLGHDYGSREWWRDIQKAGPGYLSDDEYKKFEAQYGRTT